MIGTQLGHYQVTGKLGEGGMGVVYRARDERLDRDVAIKVLPDGVGDDRELLARFEREAKVLASLNHTHIAQVHGLETDGETRALVMELVEGPTLDERFETGPLTIEEICSIGRQIAEGLEEAHERGVVHRDLKPQNIKAPINGPVKILDFGLAKALDPSPSTSATHMAQAPTRELGATTQGMILGTAGYMSPEQAKGHPVDKRSDIWAFGVVLWEMIAGRRLFEGDSFAETLADILRGDIDLAKLPPGTPPSLLGLLQRCLERDVRLRLRDIGEARIILSSIESGEVAESSQTRSQAIRSRGVPVWAFVTAVGSAAVAIALLLWSGNSEPPPRELPQTTEFTFALADISSGTTQAGVPALVDTSPDGQRFAVVRETGQNDIYDLGDRKARWTVQLSRDGIGIWSPDGEKLALEIDGQLWRHNLDDGSRRLIGDLPRIADVPNSSLLHGAWLEDDSIVVAMWRGGIYRVPARGGEFQPYVPIDPETQVDFHRVVPLPNGDLLLTQHLQRGVSGSNLVHWRSGRIRDIELPSIVDGGRVAGVSDGIVVFSGKDQRFWAVEFDDEKIELVGDPVLVSDERVAWGSFSAGTLVTVSERKRKGEVVHLDSDGTELSILTERHTELKDPAIDSRASRVAFFREESELWLVDLARDSSTKLFEVEDRVGLGDLHWHPQEDWLYFTIYGSKSQLLRIRPQTGAAPEVVLEGVGQGRPAPSGTGIVHRDTGFRLREEEPLFWSAFGTDGSLADPVEVLTGFNAFGPPSPDMKLLTYSKSVDSGTEVFVTTFPQSEHSLRLSDNFGYRPEWRADSGAIYYLGRSGMMQVEVTVDDLGRPQASPETVLFNLADSSNDPSSQWTRDWTPHPEGGFLFVREFESEEPHELVVLRHGVRRKLEEANR